MNRTATRKRQFEQQPRRGWKVGDKVKVRPNPRAILPEDRDFYGPNVGEIIGFLDDKHAANNGAALLKIKPAVLFNVGGKMQQCETRPYIDTSELLPA
jgi:hypothetical protein